MAVTQQEENLQCLQASLLLHARYHYLALCSPVILWWITLVKQFMHQTCPLPYHLSLSPVSSPANASGHSFWAPSYNDRYCMVCTVTVDNDLDLEIVLYDRRIHVWFSLSRHIYECPVILFTGHGGTVDADDGLSLFKAHSFLLRQVMRAPHFARTGW